MRWALGSGTSRGDQMKGQATKTETEQPGEERQSATLVALARLREEVESRSCPTGFKPVFGAGDPFSPLVLVGEAPGATEERKGRPFVGRAGQLLETLLREQGLDRDSVWITNVVKCRPTEEREGRVANRRPSRAEIDGWLPFLKDELAILHPRVILCLGGVAAQGLLGKEGTLRQLRGKWYEGPPGWRVRVTYHPSYLLQRYAATRETELQEFKEDLAAAARVAGLSSEQ